MPEHVLGIAYLKKGDYKEAVQFLEQAAKLTPEREAIQNDLEKARKKLQGK